VINGPEWDAPRDDHHIEEDERNDFCLTSRRRRELVRGLADRREALQAAPTLNTRMADARGWLLVFWPEEQMNDGASEFESGGFFDVQDCPPCTHGWTFSPFKARMARRTTF
jgi:hypothetical protein